MTNWQLGGYLILAIVLLALLKVLDQTAVVTLLAPLAGAVAGEAVKRAKSNLEDTEKKPPVSP